MDVVGGGRIGRRLSICLFCVPIFVVGPLVGTCGGPDQTDIIVNNRIACDNNKE